MLTAIVIYPNTTDTWTISGKSPFTPLTTQSAYVLSNATVNNNSTLYNLDILYSVESILIETNFMEKTLRENKETVVSNGIDGLSKFKDFSLIEFNLDLNKIFIEFNWMS